MGAMAMRFASDSAPSDTGDKALGEIFNRALQLGEF